MIVGWQFLIPQRICFSCTIVSEWVRRRQRLNNESVPWQDRRIIFMAVKVVVIGANLENAEEMKKL